MKKENKFPVTTLLVDIMLIKHLSPDPNKYGRLRLVEEIKRNQDINIKKVARKLLPQIKAGNFDQVEVLYNNYQHRLAKARIKHSLKIRR